ncbi:ATP-binding protein, partial [Acidiplasma aeolicum]
MNFLENYKLYLKMVLNKSNGNIDMSNLNFVDPMIILLLFDYLRNSRYIPPSNSDTKNYINTMLQNYNNLNFSNKSYLPITGVNENDNKVEQFVERILKTYNMDNSDLLNYIIGELTDNIIEHSKYTNNYILAQYYKNTGLEICIYDDGIGIPKSFKNAGFNLNNDADAIKMALNGESTKGDKERGTGLSSISRIIESSSSNEFIIISDKAIYNFYNGRENLYNLDDKYKLRGTFIGVLFKNNINNINIYDY